MLLFLEEEDIWKGCLHGLVYEATMCYLELNLYIVINNCCLCVISFCD
jgi:hypothetical protein